MEGQWIEKPTRKRLDKNRFEDLAIPKGDAIRIEDQATLDIIRNIGICEWCGRPQMPLDPHHIKSRGSGGGDLLDNTIGLCAIHHEAAHKGHIPRQAMRDIAAARNAKLSPLVQNNSYERPTAENNDSAVSVYGEK